MRRHTDTDTDADGDANTDTDTDTETDTDTDTHTHIYIYEADGCFCDHICNVSRGRNRELIYIYNTFENQSRSNQHAAI